MHTLNHAARLGTVAIVLSVGSAFAKEPNSEPAVSEWVHPGPDGKLVYKTTAAGDRIMDFSHAGYMGGGVALPDVPVKRTVEPSGGEDDTAAIQAAIDEVSALPLGERLPRRCAAGARASTRAKRPSASPPAASCSAAAAARRRSRNHDQAGRPAARRDQRPLAGRDRGRRGRRGDERIATHEPPTAAGDGFVEARRPSPTPTSRPGATSFTVADATGFAVGDTIAIQRPVTRAWVEFMQMHDLVRDGRPQTWIRPGTHHRRPSAGSRPSTATRSPLDVPLVRFVRRRNT